MIFVCDGPSAALHKTPLICVPQNVTDSPPHPHVNFAPFQIRQMTQVARLHISLDRSLMPGNTAQMLVLAALIALPHRFRVLRALAAAPLIKHAG